MSRRQSIPAALSFAFAVLAAAATTTGPAAAQGQQELQQKRDQKLAKPEFKAAPWITDYEAALARAKAENKLVLAYFTRSYSPCPPCEAIEHEVLSTDEFAHWSKQVVLFLHVTAQPPAGKPLPGDKHPQLLYELGGNAFPTLSYVDADGNLLHQVGGNGTAIADLERELQKLLGWKSLRAAVTSGKVPDKERELFLLELGMGNRPYAEMVQRAGKLAFAGDEQARVTQQLVNLQFTEVLRRTPRDDLVAGGEQLLPMFEQGRIPDCATETSYWQFLFAFAAAKKDVALFERLLATVKEKRAGDPRLKRYLHQLETQLDELKGKKG
jgi:hypothetical protein